jgi:hypothetical protein
LKQQTFNISKNQIKTDENDGSSNSRISSIPGQKPSLKSSTQSSKTTTNNPTDDDEDDDDGGINPKKIMKQRQKAEEKKRRKDDLKKKKKPTTTEDSVDEDEDGAMSKHKHKVKETKAKKKSILAQCFQDQGHDGNVSKQKVLEAEKKKIVEDSDDDDDDDGGPKRKKFIQKKTSNRSNSSKKDEVDDEDEDGGPIHVVKTYDTIKMIIPSKQPKLDNPNTIDETPSDNTDDGAIQSFKQKKGRALISVDTDDRKALETFDNIRNTKCKRTTNKHHYKTVPTEEEHARRTTVIDSSPLNSQNSSDNKIYFLRSISYCEAQKHLLTVGSEQDINSSRLRSQNNTNDHDSHYSEIRNDTTRSCINNPLHSIIKSIQPLSDHSTKQQILTQENRTEALNEKQRKRRRKIARTRWYLAYTIIHNPWLSRLRKRVLLQEKLSLQCSQQNTQQVLTPVTIDQKSITTTNNLKSETLRMRRMR